MTSSDDIFMWVIGLFTGFMLGVLYVVNVLLDHLNDPANAAPEPAWTCPCAGSAAENNVEGGGDSATGNGCEGIRDD